MIVSAIGSLVGFASAALPDVLDIVKDGQERKHELALIDRQMEMAKLNHKQKLEAINLEADISETRALYRHDTKLSSGYKWVDALRSTVRPFITYAFFLLFCCVELATFYILVKNGITGPEALVQVWGPEEQALFSTVISFWFGQRAMAKLRGRN